MKARIEGAAIRVSRPSENTLKAEVLNKDGVVIYEFPVQHVGATDTLTIGPVQIEVDATL